MDIFSRNESAEWKNEVFYQIFVRSFRDGSGDGIGDIKGVIEKLDYLQDLGITALWLNPIFPADQYHNYFPNDFFGVDPAYGSVQEFAELCRELHSRGMKILIDIELQYITKEHPWFKASHRCPGSLFADRLFYEDELNEKAAHLSITMAFDGFITEVELEEYLLVNLTNRNVLEEHCRIFSWWLDPAGTGEGVDGFRLDHVMDDLDGKGLATGLLRRYWRKIRDHVRLQKPDAFFLIEQADWSDGKEMLRRTGMDAAFSFPLVRASSSFDKRELSEACARCCRGLMDSSRSFLIIENHDISRYASRCGGVMEKARIGALLNVMLRGTPCIYYGQELGMTGSLTDFPDDMHLPMREAFPWNKNHSGEGAALWYRDLPFWPASSAARGSFSSLEEQLEDPSSLRHFYKELISLRKSRASLNSGAYEELRTSHESVFGFARRLGRESTMIIINLDAAPARCTVPLPRNFLKKAIKAETILPVTERLVSFSIHGRTMDIELGSYGYAAFDAAHA